MDSDTDISGLDPQAVKEYVLAFVTSLKQAQKQLQKLGQDVAIWKDRVALAEDKGQDSLARQAEHKLASLRQEEAEIAREEHGLRLKVSTLKEGLREIQRQPRWSTSTDADLLLAQLQMVVGEDSKVAEQLRDLEVQAELDSLKAEMRKQASQDSSPPENS